MLADREVALRLATNRDVDRKLRIAAGSRFFWVYSLSLWDPEAFWKCISGASAFALVGLFLERTLHVGFPPTPLTATAVFEYFLLGLILMWAYNLGPSWLHPTNLIVIFTLVFKLYRKNMTLDDLSAQEIGRLFPEEDPGLDTGKEAILSRVYLRIRRSPVLGSLMLGSSLAALMVALLLLTT